MNLYNTVDHKFNLNFKGHSYPVCMTGQGIPCLVIGTGLIIQRTLSPRFKQHCKVYASDLYWDARYKLEDVHPLTMERLVEDIAELSHTLQLSSYVLLGHSAFGLVALEYAKKYCSKLKGLMMIGTPIASNDNIATKNDAYFKSHADPQRQTIDSQRREAFAQQDLSQLDFSERFLKQYIWRDAPRYWHHPTFDCSQMWQNVILDRALEHFFTDILPHHDPQKNLQDISCPIFLAAGMSDYDCCPWMWSEVKNKPPKMSIHTFSQSGHYPHYEEAALFDEKIEAWLKTL